MGCGSVCCAQLLLLLLLCFSFLLHSLLRSHAELALLLLLSLLLLFFVLVVVVLVVLGVLVVVDMSLFYVILVLKMKDIIGSVLFFFTIVFRNEKKLSDENTNDCNIVAFIPVYKETEEQVLKTIHSVMNNKGNHYLLTCVISEGETSYDINKLFDEVLLSNIRPYQTWFGNVIDVTVIYGRKIYYVLILLARLAAMNFRSS